MAKLATAICGFYGPRQNSSILILDYCRFCISFVELLNKFILDKLMIKINSSLSWGKHVILETTRVVFLLLRGTKTNVMLFTGKTGLAPRVLHRLALHSSILILN